MFRMAACLVLIASLTACDAIGTMIEGYKYAQAVGDDLEVTTGIRPEVGFNWKNGRLLQITVTFPRLYDAKPLREVAEMVRAAIGKQFKQTPKEIVLSFSFGKSGSGTVAQLREAD